MGFTNSLDAPPAPDYRLQGSLDLALMIHAHQNEGRDGASLVVEIVDDQGTVVERIGPVPSHWHSVEPGLPLISINVFKTGGWYLPRAGVYQIRATVGSVSVNGGTELYVLPSDGRPGAPPPPPPGVRKKGLKFEWGHMVDSVFGHPAVPGLPCFENIRDFVALPAGASHDRDRWLLAGVSFGAQDSSSHRWSVELADADENVVGRFNEGPFNGLRPGPGHLSLGLGLMKLERVVVYGDTGDYVYHTLVDGKRVGDVRIRVIRT
jgi:hypothetical protein